MAMQLTKWVYEPIRISKVKWVHEPIWISKVKVIYWPWSRSLRFNFKLLFLNNHLPIEAIFNMEPPRVEGTKACSNGQCHMTMVAAMLIYGKNLLKSSSLEPKGWWPWNLVCSIRYSRTSNFVQMMTLHWPWPIVWQGQIWSPMLLYGEKLKQWIFQKLLKSMI